MLAVIDYGAGNLFSVKNALDHLKIESMVTGDPTQLAQANGLVLPGVGAFPDAMRQLTESGLVPTIKELAKCKPLLGICLGMQLLFERSEEFGNTAGLGLIEGYVKKLDVGDFKIPHMGWNSLTVLNSCELTTNTKTGDFVYFVHSFRAVTEEEYISCYTLYHEQIPALVHKGNIYGAQFHPEKSGACGLGMLENFARLAGERG